MPKFKVGQEVVLVEDFPLQESYGVGITPEMIVYYEENPHRVYTISLVEEIYPGDPQCYELKGTDEFSYAESWLVPYSKDQHYLDNLTKE